MSRNSGFSGIISGDESRLEWAEESMNWKLRNMRGCQPEIEEEVIKKKKGKHM